MASQYYEEGINILPSNFPQKVERKHKKKKQKKEKKPKDEPRVFLGEWVDDGVESSSSSSSSSNDESIKSTTTRTNKGASSSSNACHTAKGMNSNVSDDDSDSPSFEDLLKLIH